MKVLVIGANGNTATRVIRRLAESDTSIITVIDHMGRWARLSA